MLPKALLAMNRSDVPEDLAQEIERIVVPLWQLDGIGGSIGLDDIEVLVTANADLNPSTLARFPSLHLIVTTGTAYDYVDVDYCEENRIVLCNTPRYTGSSVAEHAIALLLSIGRRLCELNKTIRISDFSSSIVPGFELENKTAGIIGLGDIGQRIARLCQGFGMNVCFINRSTKDLEGARQVHLTELLQQADVIFLSAPLTSETRHMLSTAQFEQMKATAYVINISSDELIDPNALRTALISDGIAGAALDVIGSPKLYIDLPHTVLTPARGWYTSEGIRRRSTMWLDTVRSELAGVPRNRITFHLS